MSRIVTFYSYKGGVGRTFALANIAVLLAKHGKRVLVMDWDLEAPGLHRYFKAHLTDNSIPSQGLIHLLSNSVDDPNIDWRPFVADAQIDSSTALHIIASGDQAADYVERVRLFSWHDFFERRGGGDILDCWRRQWKESYDFVLVDSRTGITDIGGVCTVFLPDILVLVFSANEQSFERGVQVAIGAQNARRELAVPRPPLAILPLPGRFDGRDEVDEATRWIDRFERELKPFYDDWLPKQFNARQILEVTKIPYVTRFSFGEPLPVISHSVSDPELPGFYLENVARLLSSDFSEAQKIITGGTSGVEDSIAGLRMQLAQVPIDEAGISQALSAIEAELGSGLRLSELLREAGVALLRQSRFEVGEACLRRALALSEEHLGSENPGIVSNLIHLAELLQATKRLSESEVLYRRALEVISLTHAIEEPTVAVVYSNLATVLRESGRISEAEVTYRQALEILELISRPGDPSLTNAYNNLAAILRETGRLAEAEITYRRTIEILESGSQPDDPAIPDAYNNLAAVLRETRRLDEAEMMYRRALEILQMKGRLGDPAITNAYNNLASLYREAGRLDEAEMMYRRAVETLELEGRRGGPAITNAYNNLAALYRQTGRFDEAEMMYRRALEILQMKGRLGDPAITNAYNNLASLYREIGRLDEAEMMYRRALEVVNMKGRSGDPALTNAWSNLAALYRETGRLDEAEMMYRRALDMLEKTSSGRSPSIAIMLNRLGELLLAKKRPQEAELYLRKSLDIFETALDRDHPEAVKARESLASLLEQHGELDEAILLRRHLRFDVFISYNIKDRRVVQQLVRELETRRLRVWLAVDELPPGTNWAIEIQRVLDIVGSTIVCIGSSGLGPWQERELEIFVEHFSKLNRPIIPVLLPGSESPPGLPLFLTDFTWIDLSDGMTKEGLDRLVWGITGEKPQK